MAADTIRTHYRLPTLMVLSTGKLKDGFNGLTLPENLNVWDWI